MKKAQVWEAYAGWTAAEGETLDEAMGNADRGKGVIATGLADSGRAFRAARAEGYAEIVVNR